LLFSFIEMQPISSKVASIIDVRIAELTDKSTGISKDTVATGMMRGRIGNKGAVGISLKIAGTTVLFVNAHLAGKPDYLGMGGVDCVP
jgi:hypothetical protein